MTIIFSKRDDTLFLRNIWKGLDNVKVVEVESSDDYEEVEKSLSEYLEKFPNTSFIDNEYVFIKCYKVNK